MIGGQAQPPLAQPQLDTFNALPGSDFANSVASIISRFAIDNATAQAVQVAGAFERSNYATPSVFSDPFYSDLPGNASNAPPGSLLKLEPTTNTTLYTLAPSLALSRIVYQTEDLNGTCVPTSAYILWPYMPRDFTASNISGIPVVSFAHGTSGLTPDCAPSHTRNIWYQYFAPFVLALQGYAVVGTDYAGLGVPFDVNNNTISHQWGAHPAGANDAIYSAQAAQQAFPNTLSKEFVVMGHSQGGGVAWGAAQRQAIKPVEGYLGAVAGSPVTNFYPYLQTTFGGISYLFAILANTMSSVYGAAFNVADYLTPTGQTYQQLLLQLNGCQSTAQELFYGSNNDTLVNPTWNSTWYLRQFKELVGLGGKPISGPMLVLQGLADPLVLANGTEDAVNQTCAVLPEDASVALAEFQGVTHVPSLYAGQQIWLDWIADRFRGVRTSGCSRKTYAPPLSVDAYEGNVNYFLEWPQFGYEVA